MGGSRGSSPLSLPPSTSQAPSLEEHIAKGQEEKGRSTREKKSKSSEIN